MATWLDDLPSPRINYSEDLSSPITTNRMETGKSRQRQRFTGRRQRVSVEWIFNPVQMGMFEAFVAYDISEGADEFTINLPLSGFIALFGVSAKLEQGLYSKEAIAGTLKWQVKANLIVDNPQRIDYEIYLIAQDVGEENFNDFADLVSQLYTATNTLDMN